MFGGGRAVIEIEDLRKSYGEHVAVDGVSLTAREGEIFGLLGPNGAGKTTTIECISGLLRPTSGSVRVNGHDVVREGKEARRRLGVVPQEVALYPDLSARENLRYWGEAYGLAGDELDRRTGDVLDTVGLTGRADDLVEEYSGGMKRRLNFGCGVVHRPDVLLLDEPTVGVDPQSRVLLLDLVRDQADDGTCVLYTTHYMEQAERLCDRLAILDHGEVIAQGTLEELRSRAGERDVLRLEGSFPDGCGRRAAERLGEARIVNEGPEVLVLSLADASRRLPAVYDALEAEEAEVHETVITRPSLESLFIELTGRELRD